MGNMNITGMRKLLDKIEVDKKHTEPRRLTFSSHSGHPDGPLPPGFRTNIDLTFSGDTDPTAYLIRLTLKWRYI